MLHPARLRPLAALALSVTAASGLVWNPGVQASPGSDQDAHHGVAASPGSQPTLRGKQGTYTATVFVAATPRRAWSVLSNYEAMAGVMPDIREARVLNRSGSNVDVLQVYQAPYTFGQRIKATLAMRETAPRQLSYQLIQGDQIKTLRGSWSITPIAGGVMLRHQIQLDPVLPGFVRPLYYELSEANLLQSMRILKRLMEQP